MSSTKALIAKIRSHPRFRTEVTGLSLQEFDGAVVLFSSDTTSYIKREQREYFLEVLKKLEETASKLE